MPPTIRRHPFLIFGLGPFPEMGLTGAASIADVSRDAFLVPPPDR